MFTKILQNFIFVEKILEKIGFKSSITWEQFQLDNEIDVVIINNPKFKKSTIQLIVDAGAIYEPNEFLGLAHLTEHMVCHGPEYPKNSKLLEFVAKYSGYANAYTDLENIHFVLHINDIHFASASEILAQCITNPNITEENCQKEIKILEQEYKIRITHFNHQISRLRNMAYADLFPDSRFFYGNIATLSVNNISAEVNNFYQRFFTGNRMKLVITSKLPFSELKSVANLFCDVRKGVQKSSFVDQANKNDIDFNEKYLVESTIQTPINIYIKDEYKHSIIKANLNTEEFSLNIVYTFPSADTKEKMIGMRYLMFLVSNTNENKISAVLRKQKLIKNMFVNSINTKRSLKILFSFNLQQVDEMSISMILSTVHEFFNTHTPDQEIADMGNRALKNEYKRNCNDENYVNDNCLDVLDIVKTYEPLYLTNFKFNKEEIQAFFKKLGDFNNCAVFLTTKDSNLPNVEQYFNFRYGNPEKFTINPSLSQLTTEMEEQPKKNDKLWPKIVNYIRLLFGTRFIKHIKFQDGEYTLLFDNKIMKDQVSLKIFFKGKCIGEKTAIQHEFYMCWLIIVLEAYAKEQTNILNIGCKFSSHQDSEIEITGYKKDVVAALKLLINAIETNSPIQNDLNTAKQRLMRFYNEQKQNSHMSQSYASFIGHLKQIPVIYQEHNIDILNAQRMNNYYISITAVGDFEEDDLIMAYEKLKGSDIQITTCEIEQRHKIKTENTEIGNAILFSYKMVDGSIIEQLATFLLLKTIISNDFIKFVRRDNQFAYNSVINQLSVNQVTFFTFFIQSTTDLSTIEDAFKSFISNYKQIVQNIDENEFQLIKNGTCNEINREIKTSSDLLNLSVTMQIIDVYDLNLYGNIIDIINKFTLKDIQELKIFEQEPIIVEITPKVN